MVVQTPTPPSSFNTSSRTRNKDDAADDIVRGMLDILRQLELAPEMKSKLNAKWSEYKKIRAQEQKDIRAQDRTISDLNHKIYNLQVELEEERAENNQDADDSDDHL
jgi:predicted RNase H-like nuclease (RuvC/YqgF family)